ncbi:glycophorin-C isoform X1 [Vombatus ursinus]|uniref:Neurexin/syndecan/glycophorin C domain-containing protein n=1 Tax=Vombatus ursinus TaxID=29139 RepID=A0A4X2KTT1_VOMUR|nr:glycophorin-C isoform X1 [Vombatus ursinus]
MSNPNSTTVDDAGDTSPGNDIIIIAVVIAAVVFVLICLLLVILHYTCRHKGTYYTNEDKGTEFAESAEEALKNDPTLEEPGDESKKEYFI